MVAAPERDALREASYFVERLGEGMPLAGLVLNRVTRDPAASVAGGPAAAEACPTTRATRGGLLRLHAERMRTIEREQSMRDRFTAAHPKVPIVDVPALPGDVHDLAGLRGVGDVLDGDVSARKGQGAPPALLDHTGHAPVRPRSYSSRAVSSSARHEAFGRRRSSARRSRSVMPPQTPHSIRLSRASARHSKRTGHPEQTNRARFWSDASGNRASCHPAGTWRAWSSLHVALQARCISPS